MLFVIHGIDKPDSPIRNRLIDQHRAHMDAGPIRVVASGPLMDDQGEQMVGSNTIVDCENRRTVDQVMVDEPFNVAGLYETMTINRWHQRVGKTCGASRKRVSVKLA